MQNRNKQLLTEAANILERDGWGTEVYYNRDTGCRCVVGAIIRASLGKDMMINDDDMTDEAVKAALVVADHLYPDEDYNITDVYNWNDDQESAEPVIALLRELGNAEESNA